MKLTALRIHVYLHAHQIVNHVRHPMFVQHVCLVFILTPTTLLVFNAKLLDAQNVLIMGPYVRPASLDFI